MKVYKMYNEVNGYASIDFANVNMSDVAKGIANVCSISGISLSWKMDEDNNIKGDSPFYLGAFPIFEATKLKGIDFENAETATLMVEGEDFVAVAAPMLSGQIINREKSNIRLFKSGKIMSVKRFTLKKSFSYPQMFRLEEFPLYTFVCEETMKSLKELRLSQLMFEECELTD